jgi:hypothetical protein
MGNLTFRMCSTKEKNFRKPLRLPNLRTDVLFFQDLYVVPPRHGNKSASAWGDAGVIESLGWPDHFTVNKNNTKFRFRIALQDAYPYH